MVPVLVADGINLNLLPHPLSEIQVTDCRGGDKAALFGLIKSIYAAPAPQPLPDPLPNPPNVPVSYLSNLNDRIESIEPLSSQEQITLLFNLEEELRQGRAPTEVRDLLNKLRRRDDLLAKIAIKIDAALKGLDSHATLKVRHDAPQDFRSAAADTSAQDNRLAGPKLCPVCNADLATGTKFCGNCGTAVGKETTVGDVGPAVSVQRPTTRAPAVPPQAPKGPPLKGSELRRYVCRAAEMERVLADMKQWLETHDFETQQMNTDDAGVLLQIKKRGRWRDFVGMARSLNILFHHGEETLTVQIGAGDWVDKAAAGTVGLLVFAPLAVTTGFGAWQQMKMPDKVFDFIGTRLSYK